jgi:hypothetical protein
VGLEHEEAGEAAHPVDVGEAFHFSYVVMGQR